MTDRLELRKAKSGELLLALEEHERNLAALLATASRAWALRDEARAADLGLPECPHVPSLAPGALDVFRRELEGFRRRVPEREPAREAAAEEEAAAVGPRGGPPLPVVRRAPHERRSRAKE